MSRQDRRANLQRRSPSVINDLTKEIRELLITNGWERVVYSADYVRWERRGVPITEQFLRKFATIDDLKRERMYAVVTMRETPSKR